MTIILNAFNGAIKGMVNLPGLIIIDLQRHHQHSFGLKPRQSIHPSSEGALISLDLLARMMYQWRMTSIPL